MSRRGQQYVWTDGIVRGFVGYVQTPDAPLVKQIVEDYKARGAWQDYLTKCIIRVTSNGKVWSYALVTMTFPSERSVAGRPSFNMHFANHYIPKDAKAQAVRALSTVTSEYRPAVEWARKDIARRSRLPADDPGALQLMVGYDTEAPEEAVVRFPGPFGPITYSGFGKKVGHYTMEQIHEICAKAVADGSAVWAWRTSPPTTWKPSGLEIMLHGGSAALGLAFAPGTGKDTNKRTVSLNKKLFEFYDAHATWRVMVHELCHHYRDETFAKNEVEPQEREALLAAIRADLAKSPRGGMWWHNILSTHDATFVRELGRVDPKIKESAISGILFTEYADPSLVAEVAKKKELRRQAAKPIIWDGTQGRLYVDRTKTHFSLWWIPLTKGDWKPAKLGTSMVSGSINHFIEHIGAGWEQVRVTYSDTYHAGWSRPETLGQFAPLMEHNMGFFIKALHP